MTKTHLFKSQSTGDITYTVTAQCGITEQVVKGASRLLRRITTDKSRVTCGNCLRKLKKKVKEFK